MNDLIVWAHSVLGDAEFACVTSDVGSCPVLVFEDATVMGFVFGYEDVESLCTRWESDLDRVLSAYQFRFRTAVEKAWNVYAVFLTCGPSDAGNRISLAMIEENLTGTRKIARAGIASREDVMISLLPLLPIQKSPALEPADIKEEIRQRASALPARALEAFLSEASESIVLQVLEERP